MKIIIEKDYPFYFVGGSLTPGCHFEPGGPYDQGILCVADEVGTIFIEFVCRVGMPGRYRDRIFYKKYYKSSDGTEYGSKSNLLVMTDTKFEKFCQNPFPCHWDLI